MRYRLNEIFYSVQGEGLNSGMPAIFIRFARCNLNCNFCDTDFTKKLELTKEQILTEVKKHKSKNIILTGGEPTLQVNNELCLILKENGYNLCIETNGTNKVNNYIDFITVSPKQKKIKQTKGNELKLVYDTINPKLYEQMKFENFYLQPKSETKIKEIINYIKKNPQWKISTQMHKVWKIR